MQSFTHIHAGDKGFLPLPIVMFEMLVVRKDPQEKVKHAEDVFHSGAGDFIQLGASR